MPNSYTTSISLLIFACLCLLHIFYPTPFTNIIQGCVVIVNAMHGREERTITTTYSTCHVVQNLHQLGLRLRNDPWPRYSIGEGPSSILMSPQCSLPSMIAISISLPATGKSLCCIKIVWTELLISPKIEVSMFSCLKDNTWSNPSSNVSL